MTGRSAQVIYNTIQHSLAALDRRVLQKCAISCFFCSLVAFHISSKWSPWSGCKWGWWLSTSALLRRSPSPWPSTSSMGPSLPQLCKSRGSRHKYGSLLIFCIWKNGCHRFNNIVTIFLVVHHPGHGEHAADQVPQVGIHPDGETLWLATILAMAWRLHWTIHTML